MEDQQDVDRFVARSLDSMQVLLNDVRYNMTTRNDLLHARRSLRQLAALVTGLLYESEHFDRREEIIRLPEPEPSGRTGPPPNA